MKIQKQESHQGDVQIYVIDAVPETAKKIKKEFIAKSERSGHAHALCGDYSLYEVAGGFCVEVGTDGCTMNHAGLHLLTPEFFDKNVVVDRADHKPLTLKKGVYFIGIQRRKKHFSSIWEKVVD